MKLSGITAAAFFVSIFGLGSSSKAMEVKDKKVVWAHYVPWHNPLNSSFAIQKYYNYPRIEPSGDQIEDYRREFKLAMAQGIDGFFADIVAKKNASPAFLGQLPQMLKAAEGTTFLIAPCLDVKITVAQQVKDLKAMLDQCSIHPNYPKAGGKPVIMTYTFLSWTPEEWGEIRDGLKAQGYDIYLIANLSTGFKKKTMAMFEPYGKVFDMAYSFGESGINGQSVKENNDIMAGVAQKYGKDWAATLWPGYYGAWLTGRNDFYQPHRGFDQLHEGFLAIDKHSKWLHLTTWNDHDETSIMPMPFTYGNPEIIKAYVDRWKGIVPTHTEPEVFFAYHREEIPGTLLRIEAMTLPVKDGGTVKVTGKLLGIGGKVMAELPEKNMTMKDFDLVEWLVPSAALATSPFLIPEMTVDGKGYRRTARLPAMFFKSGWFQNAVTVKVPLHSIIAADAKLTLTQTGSVISASAAFDSPETVRHLTLWRNDRPLAEFSPSADGKTLLNMLINYDKPGDFDITLKNGEFLAALRAFHSKGSPEFSFTANMLKARRNAAWNNVGAIAAVVSGTEIEVKSGGNTVSFTPADLAERRDIVVGGIRVQLSQVDPCLQNHPALGLKTGRFSLKLLSRPAQSDDIFYLRLETDSGKVAFSDMVIPFAPMESVRMNVLETSVNLETSSGAAGMPGRSEYLSKNVSLQQPVLTSVAVHPAELRKGRWTFERGGTDELGDMPIALKPEMVVADGVNGGKCLKFDGQNPLTMRRRTYPIGAAPLDFFISPDGGRAADQVLIGRGGWAGGMNAVLKKDGKITVIRKGGTKTPVTVLNGKTAVPDGKWSRIRVTFDEKTIRLYLNGRLDAEMAVKPVREYGNCTWFVGGGIKNMDNYKGRLDDLTVLSYPTAPDDKNFPAYVKHAALTPLKVPGQVTAEFVRKYTVWNDFKNFKTTEGDPAKAVPADKPFAPAQAVVGKDGEIALLLGPGGSCRGGSFKLGDFALRNDRQLVLPLRRFEVAGGKASGWTALEICLKNSKGNSYNFNLGSPVHGGITSHMPKWSYRGGNFKYQCPERFAVRKQDGKIIFLVGDRKVYAVDDDPADPYETVQIAPVIQQPKDAVLIEIGAPELFELRH